MESILYAVLDTDLGPRKVRLSEALPQHAADLLFAATQVDPRETQQRRDRFGRYAPKLRPLSYPGWTVFGRPVRFFALRHPGDPGWPSTAPKLRLRDDHRIATA
jgi:hypothetical protein